MKALLIVAGLASAVAVVSGVLLMSAPREGGDRSTPGAGAAADRVDGRPGPAGIPGDFTVEFTTDVEKRLRVLEVRLDELQGQMLMAGGSGGGGAWLPGGDAGAAGAGATGDEVGSPGLDGDGGTSAGEDGPDAGGPGAAAALEALAQRTTDLKRRSAELRRELEIRKKIDLMATTMELQPVEKDRMTEIIRSHVGRADDIGARAREMFKDSPFGLAPADRATLEQLMVDRKAADKETEQAILGLVGAERWKKYRTSVKEQSDKERALKRLGQPW